MFLCFSAFYLNTASSDGSYVDISFHLEMTISCFLVIPYPTDRMDLQYVTLRN